MNDDSRIHSVSTSRWQMIARGSRLMAVTLLLAAGPAFAQWDFTPLIKVGAETDDNATIDPFTDQEIQLEGWLAELSFDLTYDSDRTDFTFTPTYLNRNYSDNPEFENDDLYLRTVLTHEMRSSSLGLRVNYDEQQVRTAERSDQEFRQR